RVGGLRSHLRGDGPAREHQLGLRPRRSTAAAPVAAGLFRARARRVSADRLRADALSPARAVRRVIVWGTYARPTARSTKSRSTAAAATIQTEPFGNRYSSTSAIAKPAAMTTPPAAIPAQRFIGAPPRARSARCR